MIFFAWQFNIGPHLSWSGITFMIIASVGRNHRHEDSYTSLNPTAHARDFLTDSGPKCYILTDWVWLHHRATQGKSYVEQKTCITCSLTSLVSALYTQRCEKSTNRREAVHINKGPLSEISIFIYCRRQRWSSSREENICEEPVSNLFKVSVEIVY